MEPQEDPQPTCERRMRGAVANRKTPATPQKSDQKTKQNNVPSVINHLVNSLPPLPPSDVTDPHDDITLPRLIEALQNRNRIRQMMIDEYSHAANTVKSMLQELDRNLVSHDNVIHEQNGQLVEKDKVIQNNKAEIERLEKRTRMQEHKIDILQKTTKIYEDDKRSMKHELETREQRLQRELSDKKRMEQRMHGMVTDTQFKWEKECDRRVYAMELEMRNKLWVRNEKLKQLKAIVMETKALIPPHQIRPIVEEHLPAKRSATPLPCPVDSPHVRPVTFSPAAIEEIEINPRSSCPSPSPSCSLSVTGSSSTSEERPTQGSRQDYNSHSTPRRRQTPAGASGSPARRRAMCWTRGEEVQSPTDDAGLVERRYRAVAPVRPLHRRACCAGGEKWVDHKPPSSMDLGTVLQPVIPNAIQVSAPSEKALSKCDRYVLTHQEVASDGEIQTKLIKGDVIKTRGGGQAVQFTDIETLRQQLTTVPSRKKCEARKKGDQTAVETRRSVAVEMRAGSNTAVGQEHHGITKRRKP